MPRTELFFLLACAFAVAIMSGSPVLPILTPSVTIASLFPPTDIGAPLGDPSMPHHTPDRQ